LIPPNPEDLADLLDLSKQGLIDRILKKVDLLEASDPQLQPFCMQIRQLAKRFQIKKIREFIQDYN
jgi:hypothetical protein